MDVRYGPGTFGSATGTVNGEFFGGTFDEGEGFLIGDLTMSGHLQFQTALITVPAFPFPLDPGAIGDVNMSAPFVVTGQLTLLRRNDSVLVFDHLITGRGMASMTLDADDRSGSAEYRLDSLLFHFGSSSPVPEPSTLMLMTIGALGVVRSRFLWKSVDWSCPKPVAQATEHVTQRFAKRRAREDDST
jgi:hypothetical protein